MAASSGAPDSSPHQVFTPEQIAEQLERTLAHPLFQRSPRLSAFLRYSVTLTLNNRASELKEYTIGVQVFDRDQSFDPQTDNVVRVNANRLRAKLAQYFQGSGQADPIVIDIPRGAYIAVFSFARTLQSLPPSEFRSTRSTVGRTRELDRLFAAFASASRTASGLLVTISGDPGLGKTTLAEDFLAYIAASRQPVWIARGRCSERFSQTDALVPVLESLDDLTRGPSGAEAAELLAREAPSWHAQIAPHPTLPAAALKDISLHRMRRELLHFLQSLSARRPVILFLDDVHWADASTCDLLSHLGPHLCALPLLILATYRPAELLDTHPFLPVRFALGRRQLHRDLPLAGLTVEDIETYLHLRFPLNNFPSGFALSVHQRTEGNPLFLTDLLHYLLDKQILTEHAHRWSLNCELPSLARIIPEGAQSMIRLQIARCSSAHRAVLECAAVQGIEFDSAVVARALSLTPEETEQRFDDLERIHRFLHSVDQSQPPTAGVCSIRYRFAHVLYQNALYAAIPPTRKSALSLAVAEAALAVSPDTQPPHAAQLALLFETGRDLDRAARYFLTAARDAARLFAYAETVVLCRLGLRTLLTLPASPDRDARELAFCLTLGMAQMATCGYAAPEVEATHRRSWQLCLRLNEKRRLVRVLWGVHTCLVNAGQLVPALDIAHQMQQIAAELNDRSAAVEALHALGTTQAFMGDAAAARSTLESIFILAPVGDHNLRASIYILDPIVTSLSMLARVHARLGNFDHALAKAFESVDLAARLAHPPSLAYATFWVGWIRHARGDHAEACRHLEAAINQARTHGLPQIIEWARVVRGSSLCHLGQVEQGIADIRQSLDNQQAMRCLLERPYCLTLLAEALFHSGQIAEAQTLCTQALQLAAETQGRSYEPETLRLHQQVLGVLDSFQTRTAPETEPQP
ncbi:MAG: AAA family ATPase [Bryobacterales bacterium]|nr:AAA family ATPase [Bryobacterales bacterium]